MNSKAMTSMLRRLKNATAPAALAVSVSEAVFGRNLYFVAATEIGPIYVAYGSNGITAVRKATSAGAFERWYAREVGNRTARAARPDPATVARVRAAIDGKRSEHIKIDLRHVSHFERAVLEKEREIPRGEIRPYAWVAKQIGRPNAVRAVGSALAKNPVPLLIPCHRVVRSDGSIGSYIFGSANKRTLLAWEGAI